MGRMLYAVHSSVSEACCVCMYLEVIVSHQDGVDMSVV